MSTPLIPPTVPPLAVVFQFKHRTDVPFAGAVGANAHLTFLSGQVRTPIEIIRAKMYFDTDHVNNVRYYWLYSKNRTTSTTGVPADFNIFGTLTLLGYYLGNGIVRTAESNLQLTDPPYYLKLHVHNTNAFAVTANASLEIVEL